MEPTVFYWTGKAIWYLICGLTIGCVLAATIVAPAIVYRRIKQHLWKWALLGELAKTGFTEDDIRWIYALPGGLPCEYDKFIKAVKRVKERGEARVALNKEQTNANKTSAR